MGYHCEKHQRERAIGLSCPECLCDEMQANGVEPAPPPADALAAMRDHLRALADVNYLSERCRVAEADRDTARQSARDLHRRAQAAEAEAVKLRREVEARREAWRQAHEQRLASGVAHELAEARAEVERLTRERDRLQAFAAETACDLDVFFGKWREARALAAQAMAEGLACADALRAELRAQAERWQGHSDQLWQRYDAAMCGRARAIAWARRWKALARQLFRYRRQWAEETHVTHRLGERNRELLQMTESWREGCDQAEADRDAARTALRALTTKPIVAYDRCEEEFCAVCGDDHKPDCAWVTGRKVLNGPDACERCGGGEWKPRDYPEGGEYCAHCYNERETARRLLTDAATGATLAPEGGDDE